MEKERRSKLLVIVALALTTMALTVGFAAFSTTLNISSNATVTPNEEDFKIVVYGLKDREAVNKFYENNTFDESDLSTTIATPYISNDNEVTAEDAIIVNSTHTISNLSVGLTNPTNEVAYVTIIKNEGKYDAYLDLTEYTYDDENKEYVLNPPVTGTCTPEEGTTKELVDATCDSVIQVLGVFDTTGDVITTGESLLTIPKGKYIVLVSLIGYLETDTRADGPFSVTFPTLNLNFSTTK